MCSDCRVQACTHVWVREKLRVVQNCRCAESERPSLQAAVARCSVSWSEVTVTEVKTRNYYSIIFKFNAQAYLLNYAHTEQGTAVNKVLSTYSLWSESTVHSDSDRRLAVKTVFVFNISFWRHLKTNLCVNLIFSPEEH